MFLYLIHFLWTSQAGIHATETVKLFPQHYGMKMTGYAYSKIMKYRHSAFLLLGLIFCLAVALRTARCFLTDRIDKDSVLYVNMAKDWVYKGKEHAFERNPRIPPLYPSLMAAGEKAGLGAELSGKAVSVLSGALLVIPVFMISRLLFTNLSIALLSAFLCAVHPSLIRISEDVLRDSLFLLLSVAALACAVHAVDQLGRRSYLLWGLGGLFAALATMTRSEGAEFFVAGGFFLTCSLFIGKKHFQQYFAGICLSFVIFLAVGLAAEKAIDKSSSSWSLIDPRIKGYLMSFVGMSDNALHEREAKYSR